MKIYRLMIKEHLVTDLKYLCITCRKNWEDYTGSGIHWKNHLKKHGNNFKTILLFESENYEEFEKQCTHYSDFYNVASSEEWANSVPEKGYETGTGKSNLNLWWDYASEEEKRDVIEKRSVSIKNNHWSKNEFIKDSVSRKITDANIEWWKNLSEEERKSYTLDANRGFKEWFQNLSSEDKFKIDSRRSKTLKDRMEKRTEEQKIENSERVRQARLNISPESALKRKEKIKAIYDTGIHDHIFEKMSKERMGENNPYSKQITIDGKTYGSVQEASRETGIPAHRLYQKLRKEEKAK